MEIQLSSAVRTARNLRQGIYEAAVDVLGHLRSDTFDQGAGKRTMIGAIYPALADASAPVTTETGGTP
jgi:hypothetical protein